MSDDEKRDGKDRRHNPDMCEMRFKVIEARLVENYLTLDAKANKNYETLEHKLDGMIRSDAVTTELVQEMRAKMFNGYSEKFVAMCEALEKLDRRMQWLTGTVVTFALGLASVLVVYLVTR